MLVLSDSREFRPEQLNARADCVEPDDREHAKRPKQSKAFKEAQSNV